MKLFQAGYQFQVNGNIAEAERLYKESLSVEETAEARTFLGWAYSTQGRIEEAIRECRRAIELDPTLGNPYNDIGCYLIEKGQLDEAIQWLERAKVAPRYEPRHFPYLNLGRLYAKQGRLWDALFEFKQAVDLNPSDMQARSAVAQLRERLN